jgi:hypothetical protein
VRRAGASNSNSATAVRSFSRCREKRVGQGQRDKDQTCCCIRWLHCCIAALLPEECASRALLHFLSWCIHTCPGCVSSGAD